jgi:hypothetical protein
LRLIGIGGLEVKREVELRLIGMGKGVETGEGEWEAGKGGWVGERRLGREEGIG